jgi:regulator of protease activity HflC (stomatin/prohibitin superfamily)
MYRLKPFFWIQFLILIGLFYLRTFNQFNWLEPVFIKNAILMAILLLGVRVSRLSIRVLLWLDDLLKKPLIIRNYLGNISFPRLILALIQIFFGLVLMVYLVKFLASFNSSVLTLRSNLLINIIILVIIGFYGRLAERICEDITINSGTYLPVIGMFYRYISYSSFFLCLVLTGGYFSNVNGVIPLIRVLFYLYVFYVLGVLVQFLGDGVTGLMRILNGEKAGEPSCFIVELFFSKNTPAASVKTSFMKWFNLDLSDITSLDYMMKTGEILVLASILVFWVMTAVYIVPPDKKAVVYSWGKITEKDVGPGIHVKLPWPAQRYEFHSAFRLRSQNIGFTPDPNQKHIIWTKSHAMETFNLVLGNGTEIIAIDMQLLYRVSDLYTYITSCQNPEEYLQALAYRILMKQTVASTFDEIMTRDRNEFAEKIRSELQKQVDEFDPGIQIIDVTLLALHPPLDISSAYEEVISAQIDKKTAVLDARTDHFGLVSLAESDYVNSINLAKAYAQMKYSTVEGEIYGFMKRLEAFNMNPDLNRFRMKIERVEKLFQRKKLYVIDPTLMRGKDKLILNTGGKSGGKE